MLGEVAVVAFHFLGAESLWVDIVERVELSEVELLEVLIGFPGAVI